MIDEYELENGYGAVKHNQNVSVKDDFLNIIFPPRRPPCGIIAEFTCNGCSAQIILALFNDDIGRPQLTARINWVNKVAPHVPTAIDKLNSYSLTGYSKELKQHVEKHDLWDVEIGSDADVPFNPKDYS